MSFDNKRTRRFLIVAFALSLLVHLIVLRFARWPYRPPVQEVQMVDIVRRHPIQIARRTPPPPTPSPAPSVAPAQTPRASLSNPRHTVGANRPAVAAVTAPSPASEPMPTPSPVATPNCAKSDTPVGIVATPPPPEIAPAARADAVTGNTRVRVTVDPDGTVKSATVIATSGSPSLDLVAVTMARGARYSPATHVCKVVAGDYLYTVRFAAW